MHRIRHTTNLSEIMLEKLLNWSNSRVSPRETPLHGKDLVRSLHKVNLVLVRHHNTQYLEKKVNLPSMDLQKNPSHQRVSKVQVSLSREVRLQNLSLAKESVVQNCSSQDLQKDSNLLTSHQQQVQHIPSVVLHPISHSYPITMVQNSSLLVVRSLRTSLLIGDRLFKEMELLLLLITVRSLRLQFQKISTMDLYVWLPSKQRITSTLFLDSSPSRFLGNPRKHTPDLLISVLEHTSSPTLQMLQEHTTTNLLVLLVLPLTS